MMYRLLTGAEPFLGDTVTAICMKQLTEAPPPLAERRPGAPQPWIAFIDRALQKEREARFQTAEEMSQATVALPKA